MTGLGLYCLDCDDNDEVEWLDDGHEVADLQQANASAEGHWRDKHSPDV